MNSDKPLHIAVICNYKLHPDRIGGMDRFFVAFDTACKQQNHNIQWFFSKSTLHPFYTGLTLNTDYESVEEAFLNDLQLKNTNYDVVITHFVELCTPFFKKIKKGTGAQIIAVDHNPRPIGGFPLKKQIKNKIKGLLYGTYIDKFVGVSKYTCSELKRDFGIVIKNKVKLIYNGIDVQAIEKRTESQAPTFVVVSHLRKSKGIQDLILAVNDLEKSIQEKIKIDVYGDGPYRTNLETLIEECKLQKQFVFMGSSSNLHKTLKNYSFMLQPTYMECFSLSILESLAANVPVVTTTVGGNTEIIKDSINGFLFKAGNTKALAEILEGIVNNSLEIHQDVSILVNLEFTLEKMVHNHLKLLSCT